MSLSLMSLAAIVAAVGIPVTISAGHIMDRFVKSYDRSWVAALSAAMVVMATRGLVGLPFTTSSSRSSLSV